MKVDGAKRKSAEPQRVLPSAVILIIAAGCGKRVLSAIDRHSKASVARRDCCNDRAYDRFVRS